MCGAWAPKARTRVAVVVEVFFEDRVQIVDEF